MRGVTASRFSADGRGVIPGDVDCTHENAAAVLRRRPPFARVSLRRLVVRAARSGYGQDGHWPDDDAPLLEVIAAIPSHAELRELAVAGLTIREEATLEALVDAAISARLSFLSLFAVDHKWPATASTASPCFGPNPMPSFAKMLARGSVTTLKLMCSRPLFDAGAAQPAFCAALKDSALHKLELLVHPFWEGPFGPGVCAALVAHPTLQKLCLCQSTAFTEEIQCVPK